MGLLLHKKCKNALQNMWRWAGTDKLTCGHGLALQELGSGGQESIASLLFERYLVVLYALIFHFSSETKLTCQNPRALSSPPSAGFLLSGEAYYTGARVV